MRQLEREGAGSVFWFGEEAAIFFRGGELGFFWGRRGFFSFFFQRCSQGLSRERASSCCDPY